MLLEPYANKSFSVASNDLATKDYISPYKIDLKDDRDKEYKYEKKTNKYETKYFKDYNNKFEKKYELKTQNESAFHHKGDSKYESSSSSKRYERFDRNNDNKMHHFNNNEVRSTNFDKPGKTEYVTTINNNTCNFNISNSSININNFNNIDVTKFPQVNPNLASKPLAYSNAITNPNSYSQNLLSSNSSIINNIIKGTSDPFSTNGNITNSYKDSKYYPNLKNTIVTGNLKSPGDSNKGYNNKKFINNNNFANKNSGYNTNKPYYNPNPNNYIVKDNIKRRYDSKDIEMSSSYESNNGNTFSYNMHSSKPYIKQANSVVNNNPNAPIYTSTINNNHISGFTDNLVNKIINNPTGTQKDFSKYYINIHEFDPNAHINDKLAPLKDTINLESLLTTNDKQLMVIEMPVLEEKPDIFLQHNFLTAYILNQSNDFKKSANLLFSPSHSKPSNELFAEFKAELEKVLEEDKAIPQWIDSRDKQDKMISFTAIPIVFINEEHKKELLNNTHEAKDKDKLIKSVLNEKNILKFREEKEKSDLKWYKERMRHVENEVITIDKKAEFIGKVIEDTIQYN